MSTEYDIIRKHEPAAELYTVEVGTMALYFLQTNIMCLLILGIVVLALRNRRDTMPARRIAFIKLTAIIAILCVSDICAWFTNSVEFEGADTAVQICNIVYFATITWAGYAWLNYVNLRIKSLEYNHRKSRLTAMIPLLITLVLLATNPWTGFFFTVKGGYARANGIIFHWIVSWGYLVYATVSIIMAMRRAESSVEKREYAPLLWFVVAPAVAAVIQMLFYGVTSTQCGMTISVLIIAMTYFMDEVSKDSLTGLNNRRALEKYLIEQLHKSYAKITVVMCDIDRFKEINDTLGHTAGDLVLKRMAEAMKGACSEEKDSLFLCRYGGDEFVICAPDLSPEGLNQLESRIDRKISNMRTDYSDNLSFGISMGHAEGVCATYEDVERLIRLADATMYEVKNAKIATRKKQLG